eukprot:460671-Pyramimonas_sp.AAC.1
MMGRRPSPPPMSILRGQRAGGPLAGPKTLGGFSLRWLSMGAATLSGIFSKRVPPPLRPALYPRAAAASAAVVRAMQVAAEEIGMCTESVASLGLQVFSLLLVAKAVCAATWRASMCESPAAWPCIVLS